jgi:hypothetical protein
MNNKIRLAANGRFAWLAVACVFVVVAFVAGGTAGAAPSRKSFAGTASSQVTVTGLAKASDSWSRYVVTNQSSNVADIVNDFYQNDNTFVGSFPASGSSPLAPGGNLTVDLSQISAIPIDFAGYAIVTADQPIAATQATPVAQTPTITS